MIPVVSVVIPAYNAAPYLPDALETVLNQQCSCLEVVVVDDGSTDETSKLLATYGPPVRTVSQRNQGVSAARNRGIAESRGRFVAFLDADDTWLPGKLSKQLSALEERPETRVCHSAFQVVSEDDRSRGVVRYRRRGSLLRDLLFRGNVVGTPSTVMATRELLMTLGGFDPDLSQCADWDLWVRLSVHAAFSYIDEPLAAYRQHSGNMSRDPRLLEKDSRRVLEKGFALPDLPSSLRAKKRLALARNEMVLAGTYSRAGMWREALRCAWWGLRRDPRRLDVLLAFPIRAMMRRMPNRLEER